jgi:23S rRNA (cytosine1962-C5)-methyltransferase
MNLSPIAGEIILKKNKEDFVYSLHRWIFSGAIDKVISKQTLKNGDIIKVLNHKNQLVGYAFYEKPDQIVARIFYFGNKEIQDFSLYFINLLEKIYFRKQQLYDDSNAFRFIHSESDGVPGIICDIYHDFSVIQMDFLKSDFLINILVNFLYKKNIKYILLKHQKELKWLSSLKTSKVEFKENNINFIIQMEKFQKTGYFLDQKINRKKLMELSRNKIVLDAFCYIGGFGIHALKNDAKEITFVDSQNLKSQIYENLKINHIKSEKTKVIIENVFNYFKDIQDNYFDIIIIDPPAFVKSKTKIKEGIKGYINLNRLAIKKIKSSGYIFTFSCSQFIDKELFRKIIFLAAKEEKRNVYIKEYLTQAPDHTISVFHPEGEYLKGFILYVE